VLEIVIAIVGACIAVGAAVINGISARRIAVEKESLSSASAALSVELERTDRFFDLATQSRARADLSIIFLHIHAEAKGWIRKTVENSIQSTLCDALVFGHRAATGTDPNDDATREYERRAHSIVELERAIALGVLKTPDNIAKAANADAWPAFKALREKQITGYWKKRSQTLQEQEKLKTKSTRLDTRREFISNLAVSLQILGLMVVLAKDLLN
jgi:hypothetical protein